MNAMAPKTRASPPTRTVVMGFTGPSDRGRLTRSGLTSLSGYKPVCSQPSAIAVPRSGAEVAAAPLDHRSAPRSPPVLRCGELLHPEPRRRTTDRVGFEPTVPLRVHRFSRPAVSTAHAPVRTSRRRDAEMHRRSVNTQRVADSLRADLPVNPNPALPRIHLEHFGAPSIPDWSGT